MNKRMIRTLCGALCLSLLALAPFLCEPSQAGRTKVSARSTETGARRTPQIATAAGEDGAAAAGNAAARCDYLKLFNCDHNVPGYGVDARNRREGTGALINTVRTAGALNLVEFGNIKSGADPVRLDASFLWEGKPEELALGMWLWLSQANIAGGDVRLSSRGSATAGVADSIAWYFDAKLLDQVTVGEWSWVVLPFDECVDAAAKTPEDYRAVLADIRYLRVHFLGTADGESDVTTMKLDDIRLVRNTPAGRAAPLYDGSDGRVGCGTGAYHEETPRQTPTDAPAFYRFLNCDDDWSNDAYAFLKDEANYKEGRASVSFYGTGVMQFFAGMSEPPYGSFGNSPFLQAEMENRSIRYAVADAYLGFWFYYDSATDPRGIVNGRIELGSNRNPDRDLFYFDSAVFKHLLAADSQDGWHWLALPLSEAARIGEPDLDALNYFRVYLDVGVNNAYWKLDDVRILRYDGPQSLLPPDYTAETVPAGAGTGDYPTVTRPAAKFDSVDCAPSDFGRGQRLFYRNDGKAWALTAAFAGLAAAAAVGTVLLVKRTKRGG